MKLVSLSIALLTFTIPVMQANAEPNSCKISAITAKEKEAVDILQEMYLVQSDLRSGKQRLDELNYQMTDRPDRRDADAVAQYNNLVGKYNSFVKDQNQLSNEYNELRNSYNALVNSISPSTNIAFTTCLNSELFVFQSNTNSFNIESLNTRMKNLKNYQENLRTNLEDLQY